jgi:hypothetical protein
MQARVTTQITIAASPAEVFAYLIDLKRHFLWNPHLHSITPQVLLTPGLTYKSSSLLLGVKVSGLNRVTKLVKERELELENDTGALHYRVNYLLRRRHNTTLLICATRVSGESQAFAFATPVLKLLARRELQADLQALKIAVEQQLH